MYDMGHLDPKSIRQSKKERQSYQRVPLQTKNKLTAA